MKKTIRIIVPIILAVAIVLCTAWYLLVYDREFTRDVLLSFARYSESQGDHGVATWFYNRAYSQAGNSDAVAIELAQQYKNSGNYTKAEFTLSNAIADGGGMDVYIALCKLYVEQDKLLDAVNMLNNVTNPEIREQLESLRPSAPVAMPDPGFYSQYISVSIQSDADTIYATGNGEYPTTSLVHQDPIPLGDGENTIYAISVSENGLVSPVSIFGYTVGGVVERMEFADAAIEAEIRSILNVSEEKELFTNDLWTITSFTVPAEAKSYADLKHMVFLEELVIEKGVSDQLQYISSISTLRKLTVKNTNVSQDELHIIAALPVLNELTLNSTGLSGIAPLKAATGLMKLDLRDNTIRAIDAVKEMPQLQELNLKGNALTDLSALSGCTALTKLDISSNNLTSLSPISSLTALTRLDASTNALTDLGDIGKLTGLTYLSLASNKLTVITGVSACTVLTELNISSNEIADITTLSSLNKLMHLDFSYNKVKEIPAFSNDCALVTINGANNQLSTLQPLGGLESLNEVNMDYNTEISSVEPLAKCPVLIKVNVYATKVKEVTVLTDQSIEVNYNPAQD